MLVAALSAMQEEAIDTGRLSSLPLQVVIYFSGWYLLLFYPALLAALVYKAVGLSSYRYPAGNLAAEVLLLFLLSLLDVNRIFFSAKGNLTSRKLPLITSLVLSVPSLCGYLYLTLWQNYVLTAEVVLLVIALVGLGLKILLGIVTLITFQRASTS